MIEYGIPKLFALEVDNKFEPNMEIIIYSGYLIGFFEDIKINGDFTGIDYKEKYLFNQDVTYTDFEGNLKINNIVFYIDFIRFLSNSINSRFSSEIEMFMPDFDIKNDKQVKPRDISILAIKKTNQYEEDEEFFINKISSSQIEIPSLKDNYMLSSMSLNFKTKSMTDMDILDYKIQTYGDMEIFLGSRNCWFHMGSRVSKIIMGTRI